MALYLDLYKYNCSLFISSSDTHGRTINIYQLHVNQPWVSDDVFISDLKWLKTDNALVYKCLERSHSWSNHGCLTITLLPLNDTVFFTLISLQNNGSATSCKIEVNFLT